MDETLAPLLREPKAVQVGGKTYTLRPFGILAVPVMSRLVGDVWGQLMLRPDLLANRDALTGWLLTQLPGLIETKIEDVLTLLAMQTGESRDALVAMPLDDFVELAQAALEDGQDFFIRRILPKLPAAVKMRAALGSGNGPTPSPPSSPQATAATTSSTTA